MHTLAQIAAAYRKMPNRGALLTLSDNGWVGNGMVILAQFDSRRTAIKALKVAGFEARGIYWKLAVEKSDAEIEREWRIAYPKDEI